MVHDNWLIDYFIDRLQILPASVSFTLIKRWTDRWTELAAFNSCIQFNGQWKMSMNTYLPLSKKIDSVSAFR